MYAIISNNQIIQYPANPIMENLNVSFPENWSGGIINDIEYVVVVPTPTPNVNFGWMVQESRPQIIDGVWTQSWNTILLSTNQLINSITDKRYEIETGGITRGNTVFATDRDSQIKYMTASFMLNSSNSSINWKINDTDFITLTASDMANITNKVFAHVQAAYDQEKYYINLINSTNSSILANTDFTQGWPDNS